jgi:hypothetical protein
LRESLAQQGLDVAVPTPVCVVYVDERDAAAASEIDRSFHPGCAFMERIEQRIAVVVFEAVEDIDHEDAVALPEHEHAVPGL